MKRLSFNLQLVACLALLTVLALPVAAQSKKDRDQAKKLKDTASKAFQQKNYREAADAYGQALTLVPTDAETHYRKGFAHFNLKEYDPATNEFTLALSQGFKPLEIY